MLGKELSMTNAKSDSIIRNESVIAMPMIGKMKHPGILGNSLKKQLVMKLFRNGMKQV